MSSGVLERVPVADGYLSDGEFLVIDDYQDLAAVQTLCATAGTIGKLWENLRPRELASAFDSLRAWWLDAGEGYRDELHARVDALEPEDIGELDRLSLALEIVDELWRREVLAPNGKSDTLALALAIAVPGQKMEFGSEEPAFVLTSGSILATLTGAGMLPVYASAWLVALARGRGAAAKAIADSLATELRLQRFQEIAPEDVPLLALPRLDVDSGLAVEEDGRSIVFVHGLLSTDLGTFDGFIRELHARQPALAQSISLFGWPHDTLTGIDNSAHQLASLVHDRLGSSHRFVFVCHSRGGLVGRAAAMTLYQIDPAYRTSLKGCITFGTPHEGAEFAQVSSGDSLAYFVAIGAARIARDISFLSDLLLYRRQQKGGVIQGIEDLRPPDSEGFIASLQTAELADAAKGVGRLRHLPLTAIGGDYRRGTGAIPSLARRFFGPNTRHDLVVGTHSSLPTSADRKVTVDCTHSDYCSEALRTSTGMTAAIDSVVGWLT